MTGGLLLFEDRHWSDLRPLTDLLPVPALAFGGSTVAERWLDAASPVPGAGLLAIEAREVAIEAWREAPRPKAPASRADGETLAVNAAALPGAWVSRGWEAGPRTLWLAGGRIAGARLPFEVAARGLGQGARFESFLAGLGLTTVEVEARFLSRPWDLFESNLAALAEDLEGLEPKVEGELHRLAAVYQPDRVALAPGSRIDAYAVLDAREGPIRIGSGAAVLSHTVVVGPCAVGAGARLLGGVIGRSTIGPGCRIAGEVDSCVWQGWSNKSHHGFVGHSVVGEWVNLGALTTTSDLKNTYGPVRVRVGREELDTGLFKVGSFVGAHVKTGIGTLLPTGASIGTGSNLFGGGRYVPRHVPTFGWWDGEVMREHGLERFLETARMAMARRERPLRPADEVALRALHQDTQAERRSLAETAVRPA
ncbi:MAG TPA: putative sugar nucleotidyl transferase [Candidatus Eisenbacteria bacterium]